MAAPLAIAMGVAALASALGGVLSGRKRRAELSDTQRRARADALESKAMFDKEYHTPYTESTDAKAALETARGQLAEVNKQAAQAGAITGASNEQGIAQKEASGKAYGNIIRSIAGQGQAYKNAVRGQYLGVKARNDQRQDGISAAQMNAHQADMESWNNLFQNALGLGMSMYGGGAGKGTGDSLKGARLNNSYFSMFNRS